jgi:autoinducer 2-degrading protein
MRSNSTIVPAEYEKFKNAILENAAASVKEPGCRQFDVLFEDSDPHHVFLYEVYDDDGTDEADGSRSCVPQPSC